MRKLALILVLALALPAAAFARGGDKGDGTFAVKNAVGQFTVQAKGTILGHLDEGSVAVIDTSPAASDDIQVLGWDQKKSLKNGTVVYKGTDMRFRVVGGWYSLTVIGVGIDVSAVGMGSVNGKVITDGLFSTDGSPFRSVPTLLYLDSFGAS